MIRSLCVLIFKLSGWRYIEDIPKDLKSFVMIGAPHTANYDFIPAMAIAALMKRKSKFVIKSEWLKFPLNLVMKPAGAIGIDRETIKIQKGSSTDAMANLFITIPDLVLMIAPEGTRSPNENWKTGFYYIAQKAKVPIALGFCDYERKIAGIGKVIYPTDFETDMRIISNFYKDYKGSNPDNFKLDRRFS